jgi:hypothetical protein
MRPTPVQRFRDYARSLFLPPDPDDGSRAWAWAKKMHWLALFLLGLPFASYWIHLFCYAANAPFIDDYDVILGSTNHFITTAGLLGKVGALWAQHNEHRLIIPRIIALLQYYILGHINFRHLTLIGNLFWSTSLILIIREHRKKTQLPLLFYVPLSFLWFSFVHYENTFWAMASLQNYGAVFFSVVALGYLQSGKTLAACLACVAGVLTSMMCWPLFMLCTALALVRRAWRQAAALAGTALFLAALYFHHYTLTSGHPLSSVAVLDIEATLSYGLAVMGSVVRCAGYSITLGLFSVAAILYLIFLRKTSPWSIALALLALSQAATIAIGRAGYAGLRFEGAVIASRFTSTSIVAAVALCLLVLDAIQDSRRAAKSLLLSTLLAMTYCFAMTAKLDIFGDLAREHSERENSMASYVPQVRLPLYCDGASELCEPILLQSKVLGVFDYTAAMGRRRKPETHWGPLLPSLEMTSKIEFYDGARMQGWALIPGRFATKSKTYLVFEGGSEPSYWIPTERARRPEASISQHIQFDYDMKGFEAFPALYDIPQNDYRVGIAIATADGLSLKWTDYTYQPTR